MTFEDRRLAVFARICADMGWPVPDNPSINTVSHWIWLECGLQALGQMLDEMTVCQKK